MTTNNRDAVDELTARLTAHLDATNYTVISNPVGWECRRCGGRLTLADEPSRDVGRIVDNLAQAATSHERADHHDATKWRPRIHEVTSAWYRVPAMGKLGRTLHRRRCNG